MSASPPRLIPRRLLFGNPERASVQISPDGRQLGWLAPVDGVLNVWVAPAGDPAAARVVTQEARRGIRYWRWAERDDHLLYMQDHDGDENYHVYRVDVESMDVLDLTPGEGLRATILATSPLQPDQILVQINDRDPEHHDVHRVDLRTGARDLIQRNDGGFADFVADARFRIRLALRFTEDGGVEYLQPRDGDGWESWLSVPQEDQLTTFYLGFDRSGETLYLQSSLRRDTAALYAVDFRTGQWELLAEDPKADAGRLIRDARTDRPLAISFPHARDRWVALDADVQLDLDVLRRTGAEFSVTSQTRDGKCWVVALEADDAPVRYYLYRRGEGDPRLLFSSRPELEGLPLARTHSTVVRARDGLELVCYYTLPAGTDAAPAHASSGERPRVAAGDDADARPAVGCEPADVARPAAPLPAVLHVHGGPWGRDRWGFHPSDQWLANRGYVVLSVNFRGSTGFGKRFVNAGDREWAGRMHDDLLDAVSWAVGAGIADPARVAIYGGSYGGYAALVGMTFTPEVFACGVSVVGPSNLVTLLESIPPYWKPARRMFTTRMGDPATPEGREFLLARSPLTRAGHIRRPLLIGQGANDPRVKQAESDQIVTAMKEKKIPVTYVLFPDEGHGFAKPENRLRFYAAAEKFLAEYLGGRNEP